MPDNDNSNFVGPDQKRCSKCGIQKPLNCFTVNNRHVDGKMSDCRECRKPFVDAANRKWRAAHPEKIIALNAGKWRRLNPQAKTHAQINAEKVAKANRTEKPCKKCGVVKPITDFYAGHKTADGRTYQCATCIAEQSRARYKTQPEKEQERVRRWQQRNIAFMRHNGHMRRVRERKVSGSHTLAEWNALCHKFDNRCVCCGERKPLTRDHIIPLIKPWSSDDIGNIQPCCVSCNSSKQVQSIDYRNTPFTRTGQRLL